MKKAGNCVDHSWRSWPLMAALAVALAACVGSSSPLGEQQVVDLAWEALEPNTSSHSLANWEVIEARQVLGQDVGTRFEGEAAPGCLGPKSPANEQLDASGSYWLIRMRPRPATPSPVMRPLGPTVPPAIPEPHINLASFLIDAEGGRIAARKLYCVVY